MNMKKMIIVLGLTLGFLSYADGGNHAKMKAGHSLYLIEQAFIVALDAHETQAMGSLGMVKDIDPINQNIFEEQIQHSYEVLNDVLNQQDELNEVEKKTLAFGHAVIPYITQLKNTSASGVFNTHQFRFLLNRSLKLLLDGRKLLKFSSMGSEGALKKVSQQHGKELMSEGKNLYIKALDLFPISQQEEQDAYNQELKLAAQKIFELITAN